MSNCFGGTHRTFVVVFSLLATETRHTTTELRPKNLWWGKLWPLFIGIVKELFLVDCLEKVKTVNRCTSKTELQEKNLILSTKKSFAIPQLVSLQ